MNNFYVVLSFFTFILLSPVFLAVGIIFTAYQHCVGAYLKNKYGKKFKGFIGGEDILWTLGGDSTSATINVVAYIDFGKASYDPVTTPKTVLSNIRRIHGDNLVKRRHLVKKFFYKRQYTCGYSFWLDEDPGPIEKYVRPVDFEVAGDFVTQEQMKKFFSKICNRKLPDGHTRNWELLVSNKGIEVGEIIKLPLLYRISHIMGDGVTLLRFFLEVLADEPKPYAAEWDFWKEKPKSKFFHYIEKLKKLVEKGVTLVFLLPYYIFCDILRPSDHNVLHPKQLTGERILDWVHESDAGVPLLQTLKKIKRQHPGTRFSEIVIALLTKGIAKVLSARSNIVPSIQGIMAERVVHEDKQIKLHNKYSFHYKNLPIEDTLKANNFTELLHKISAPISHSEMMVRDILFLMVPTIFPKQVLGLLLDNFKSTFVVSVLPALNSQVVVGGYKLSDLTVCVPNGGRIAISVAVMTFGDKLHISIQADGSAISDTAEVKMILDEMINTIRTLEEPEQVLKMH